MGWSLLALAVGVGGCAATVAGAAADAAVGADRAPSSDVSADVPTLADLRLSDGAAADREPLRCLPPADGPLRTPPGGPVSPPAPAFSGRRMIARPRFQRSVATAS